MGSVDISVGMSPLSIFALSGGFHAAVLTQRVNRKVKAAPALLEKAT
jgi:hypothetical protein